MRRDWGDGDTGFVSTAFARRIFTIRLAPAVFSVGEDPMGETGARRFGNLEETRRSDGDEVCFFSFTVFVIGKFVGRFNGAHVDLGIVIVSITRGQG